MKIDWNQTIAGIPLPAIRDMLQMVGRGTFTADSIAKRLRVQGRKFPTDHEIRAEAQQAMQILRVLAASELIEKSSWSPGRYVLSANGMALCATSLQPRIKRGSADRIVDRLKRKIHEINSNPAYMHDITQICLYGSYIRDEEDLGDIDVGYEICRRWTPAFDYQARLDHLLTIFPAPQKLERERAWPEMIIKRHLRVSQRISLTDMRYVQELGCPYQVIYPEVRFVEARPEWKDKRTEIRIRDDDGQALENLPVTESDI